ncbi:hypothetical protein NQ318_015223 [Aromia moschata]|uniref:DUF7041 domain-containing protein n=1 Tax=Aromia moschata TaxID=1265417 RepID=A0AAV8XKF1_9CUCU|nr:hypothetical protein NQ318_015223 [Aromia moschata]
MTDTDPQDVPNTIPTANPSLLNQQFVTHQTFLKSPPFWISKPEIWFTQVEAQFNVAKLTNDRKRYDQVLAELPLEVIDNIYDVLSNPPADNLYTHLKHVILIRLSSSEEKRLDDLLSGSQMDRKPSEYYRYMLEWSAVLILLVRIYLSNCGNDVYQKQYMSLSLPLENLK